jgi:hypothetical protein
MQRLFNIKQPHVSDMSQEQQKTNFRIWKSFCIEEPEVEDESAIWQDVEMQTWTLFNYESALALTRLIRRCIQLM